MTGAERERLRSEALRLLVEAAIAAGGDMGFQRGPIVKALLRRGAGRTFAYDTAAELVGGGEVEQELRRRGVIGHPAEKPACDATAQSPAPQTDPIGTSITLLDQIGSALFELADAELGERNRIIHQALSAVDQAEELLRGARAAEAAAG